MLRLFRSWSILESISVLAVLILLAGCQSKDSKTQQQGPPPLPENELAIEDPWVKPASAGETSALYMTIANGQQSADTLLRVRAPIVDSSAAYVPASDGSKMEMMGSLPVPARSRMTLKPGSTHVKLVNLGQSLEKGGTPILNLEFAKSGLQRVRVPVRTSPPSSQQ